MLRKAVARGYCAWIARPDTIAKGGANADSHSLMRCGSETVKLVGLETGGGCDDDGSRRAGLCRDRHHRFSRDDGGNRLDDAELMGEETLLRVALPYVAVILCLAVTAWLAFAHLF
jgi:hypothetical protein